MACWRLGAPVPRKATHTRGTPHLQRHPKPRRPHRDRCRVGPARHQPARPGRPAPPPALALRIRRAECRTRHRRRLADRTRRHRHPHPRRPGARSDHPVGTARSRPVDRLSLHPGNAAGTGPHAYTEVERRTRPATHPLITHDGRLLVLPWLVHTAQELYAAYLDEGRLPHPDLPQPVRKALRHHREQLDKRLEADLQTIARDAGLPHRYRLLEKTAAQLGIPGLIGEINLLIADPATQRLWVIEVKNPEGAVAPYAVIQHIQRFTQNYRDKLLNKTVTITVHATAAARACQAPEDLDWEVIPLMVTRSIEPAAFLADPKVPFTIADHLARILTASTTPRPGWNSPDGAPE
ncbi:hypothetical protein OG241_09065 [Streptomyces sp. NBC_01390]|uniref:hypothetical protein n=1 Tax=Streptomyces sp. NBC_01390 TaxID=2903850 RepID=UPI003246A106